MTPATPRLILALAALLVVAGCGDDAVTTTGPAATTATAASPSTTSQATTTTAAATTTIAETTTTTAATTTAATTTTAAFDGDTGPEAAPAQGSPTGLLTDVRFAQRAEGFTRIVFDFQGSDGIPAYDVRYEPGPFLNMAEAEVPVAGSAFLLVRIYPGSRVDLSVDPYVMTYTGPERIPAGTAGVEEIVFVEDFEANMIWVVGLTGEKPFRVGTLTGPPRIFIDVAD